MLQGAEAMGDQESTAALVTHCQQVGHESVRRDGIKMLAGLVQQHQGGRSRQGPSQKQPTPLPTRQRCGIRADDGVNAVGKGLEPLPEPGPPQQLAGLGGGDVPPRHAQVLQDTGVEDVRVLRGQAHPGRHL